MDTLIISETPIHIAKETIVHDIAWGSITGSIANQADLNTVLDAFADDLSNLAEEVETKASAAAVVQALTTKADLIDGVIPASQLPSYVDDVLVYSTWSAFPVVGETGKIYVTEDTNKTYRWSGSGYVVIADGVALGETATTAYRGDRGKAAYDHSLSQGNPHNATTSDIPEGNKYYFTESRAKASILTGVIFTNKNKVTSTDSIETAVGKLQGQLEDVGLQTWVDINTLASVVWHANIDTSKSKIEISKYQNAIYVRGYLWFTGAIGSAGIKLVGHKQAGYMCDITYLQSATVAAGLARFYMGGSNSSLLLDARQEQLLGDEFILVSVNAVSAGNLYHIAQTAVGKARS